MKRHIVALALGSLFALPAFANNEIDPGYAPLAVRSVTSEQVREELLAAKRSGNWMINAELGTVSRPSAPAPDAGKTREVVRAELEQAYRSGEMIVNAELGTTAKQL